METIYCQNLDLFTSSCRNYIFTPEDRQEPTGSVITERIYDNIHINRIDLELNENITEYCEGPPTVSISFLLKGRGKMAIQGGRILDIESGMTLIFYSPQGTKGYNMFYQGGLRIVDIRYSLKDIQAQELPPFSALASQFEKNFSHRDSVFLASPTTPQLMQVVKQIENCYFTGNVRKTYLRAKSLEILAIVMAKIKEKQGHLGVSCLQRQAIYTAIKLIHSDYCHPWTIKMLSRAVGLNERKLKEGFRSVINCTFHQYLENVRMVESIKHLKTGMNVIEVAAAVGYASPSHFSKRFKQHYCVNPKAWQGKYS